MDLSTTPSPSPPPPLFFFPCLFVLPHPSFLFTSLSYSIVLTAGAWLAYVPLLSLSWVFAICWWIFGSFPFDNMKREKKTKKKRAPDTGGMDRYTHALLSLVAEINASPFLLCIYHCFAFDHDSYQLTFLTLEAARPSIYITRTKVSAASCSLDTTCLPSEQGT